VSVRLAVTGAPALARVVLLAVLEELSHTVEPAVAEEALAADLDIDREDLTAFLADPNEIPPYLALRIAVVVGDHARAVGSSPALNELRQHCAELERHALAWQGHAPGDGTGSAADVVLVDDAWPSPQLVRTVLADLQLNAAARAELERRARLNSRTVDSELETAAIAGCLLARELSTDALDLLKARELTVDGLRDEGLPRRVPPPIDDEPVSFEDTSDVVDAIPRVAGTLAEHGAIANAELPVVPVGDELGPVVAELSVHSPWLNDVLTLATLEQRNVIVTRARLLAQHPDKAQAWSWAAVDRVLGTRAGRSRDVCRNLRTRLPREWFASDSRKVGADA